MRSVVVIGDYTSEGWEVRLKPHGAGRFFPAAFLSVWLCGWLAGEAFALVILAKGVRSMLTGEPPAPGRTPLHLGPALGIGAFLLVWLTIWTFGGIAAIGELLRLVWAEDRVLARPDGLTLERRLGPFRSRRQLARTDLRWIETAPRTATLVAETSAKTVELSRLGSRDDREGAARMLREWLGMSERVDPTTDPGLLPEGWEEATLPEGGVALVSDPRQRRAQARAVTAIAAAAGGVTVFLAIRAWSDASLVPLLALVAAASAGMCWGAWRLHHIRGEWAIGGGRITLRRRSGPRLRDLFVGRSLELSVSRDSDGDEWYALDALDVETRGEAPAGRGPSKSRHRITQSIHDPSTPRHLGAWLAQRAGVPFRDRSGPGTRDEEIRMLRGRLGKSGVLGRLFVGLLDRAQRGGRRGA